jgi:hypothetical protein
LVSLRAIWAKLHQQQFGLRFRRFRSNIAPMALLTRCLALVCSVLLALPSGWCCVIGAPCCDKPRPAEKSVAQAPPVRHKCCCHQSTEQKPNDPTPAPKPSPPIKACSCERAPAVTTEVARLAADLVAAPLATPADFFCCSGIDPSELCRIFDPSPPPLHVTHCVWLC